MAHPNTLEQHELYVCFLLKNVLFVPHFVRSGWVGPGYMRTLRLYTRQQLESMGAAETVRALWPRLGHDPITSNSWKRGLRNGK